MAVVSKTTAQFVADWENGIIEQIRAALAKPGDATHVVLCILNNNGARQVWDVGP